MSIKALIIKQFKACYDTNTWFVSIQTALENLDAKDALAKTSSDTHSIFELVYHLYFFNKLELDRFRGIPDSVEIKNGIDTFQHSDADWEELTSK